jgi:hypothetical protein
MEDLLVFLNGKQIFATDSGEDAEIIELTLDLNEALNKALAKEKLKLSSMLCNVDTEYTTDNCLWSVNANYCLERLNLILGTKLCPGSYFYEFQETQIEYTDVEPFKPKKPKPARRISTSTRLLLKILIDLLKTQGQKCVYSLSEPINIKG